jgi:hypothetical protein
MLAKQEMDLESSQHSQHSRVTTLGEAALDVFFRSVRRSCRFVLEGHERCAQIGACIEVFWNRDSLTYGALLPRVMPVLGAWGARATEVVEALRRGDSTSLGVNGPAGPPAKLKPALRLAARSRRPIVPVRVDCTQFVELPTWDRRRLPLPGSSVTISFLDPIDVEDENDAEAAALLEHALG